MFLEFCLGAEYSVLEVRLRRVVFGGILVTMSSRVYFSAERDIAKKSGISERGLRLTDL
jgi:hypothetical protein